MAGDLESPILASGRDDTPAHQLRLLLSGTEVELAGGMPFGISEALRELLAARDSLHFLL